MVQDIFQQLLQNTFTTDTLYQRIRFMREWYEMRLYSQDESERRATVSTFCEKKGIDTDTSHVLEMWEQYFSEHASGPEEVVKTLRELEEQIHLLPSVVIYVPMIFDDTEIVKIAEWFRRNVRQGMLLEVKVDANVTGGCALIWNNTYYDFSLRYFMRKERAGIVSMLNAYDAPK